MSIYLVKKPAFSKKNGISRNHTVSIGIYLSVHRVLVLLTTVGATNDSCGAPEPSIPLSNGSPLHFDGFEQAFAETHDKIIEVRVGVLS